MQTFGTPPSPIPTFRTRSLPAVVLNYTPTYIFLNNFNIFAPSTVLHSRVLYFVDCAVISQRFFFQNSIHNNDIFYKEGERAVLFRFGSLTRKRRRNVIGWLANE